MGVKTQINDSVGQLVTRRRISYTAPWTVYSVSNIPMANNRYTEGVNTPHFHKRKRRGDLLPFTRFTQYENRYLGGVANVVNHRVSDGYTYERTGPGMNPGNVADSGLRDTVASHIPADVSIQSAAARHVNSGWDVLTFAAELGQTVNMFKGLARKVLGLLHGKPPGTPWNLWLEGRYGWRTLAYDMEDIEQALSRQFRSNFRKSSAGQSLQWTSVVTGSGSGTGVNFNWTQLWTYSFNGRAKVISKSEPPRFQVNVLKTAWEVTRLSFVLDWFINVGRAIDALQLSMSVDYTAGYGVNGTITCETQYNYTAQSGWTMDSNDHWSSVEGKFTARDPVSIPLIPLISVNLDRYKVLDLVALLVQALRR